MLKYFDTGKIDKVYAINLEQGDLLLESVNEFIEREHIENGVILSCIGTLDRCMLHMVTTTGYPPVEYFRRWEDTPLELSSTDGFIAGGKPHLHAVVSDKDIAFSGHVEEGCRVLYLMEIVIGRLDGKPLARHPDEKGINKLG